MYSYNIGKMSVIYLDNTFNKSKTKTKKKIQEVYLRPLMNIYYDKITSDRIKRNNNTFEKSKTKYNISHNNIDVEEN